MFKSPAWRKINKLSSSDATLTNLSKELQSTVLLSKTPSTKKAYSSCFHKYKQWCDHFKFEYLPKDESHIALYLMSVLQQAGSFSRVLHVFSAITWGYKLAGVNKPPFIIVNQLMESAKRQLSKPPLQKDPITPEILEGFVNKYCENNASLIDLRDVSMFLIGYAGFLRFNEIVNIRRSDIEIHDTHLTVNIRKSKTDVYNKGSSVLIAKTGKKTCPVLHVCRYLNSAAIPVNSNMFIFRAVTYFKKLNVYHLRSQDRPMCYTRVRECLFSKLSGLGLDPTKFGTHGLRAGGLSSSVAKGVDHALSKKHGRWKSDSSKDLYIRQSVDQRLQVSKNLGI